MPNLCLKLFLLGCLFTSHAISAVVEVGAPAPHSVPKGLEDIVQLINQTQFDRKSIEFDLKLISSNPPPGISKDEITLFYYKQAVAADSLGKIDLKIEKIKKVLEYLTISDRSFFHISSELIDSELAVGRPVDAINRSIALLPRLPQNAYGQGLNLSANLVKAYSEAGDFEKAETNMRELDSGFIKSKSLSNFASLEWSWGTSYFRSVGELAYQKGKFNDAEIAFRKAIDLYEPGMVGWSKKYDFNKLAGAFPGQDAHPNFMFSRVEYFYRQYSDVLVRLGKTNESEFYAREGLKKSLQRTGKASVSTSAAMRQLAIVMLARERIKDAIYLLNQAVLGLKEAGVSPESVDLARTQKTLASAYIADERYADALKIYAELDLTIKTYPDTARFVDTNTLDRVLALVRTGMLQDAESRAKQLLAVTEARVGKKSKETTDTKLMLAMTLSEAKKDEEARALFVASVSELVELDREVSQDSDGASSKEKKYLAAYIESYLALLARQYEKSPNVAVAAEAFVLGDMARSSGVQKALSASTARANITDPRLAELVRKEQDLNQQITFLSRFVKELAMQPANQQLPEVQKKIKADIVQLRLESKQALYSIGLDFPTYAELISPKPASLERVQKTLGPNEVLITWFIGKNKSYVWAVPNSGSIQFKSLTITQSQLRKEVAQLRKALDPQVSTVEEIPAFNFALAHQLYESLFKPVQSALENKNTLVLVPHDEIAQLPLAILNTGLFVPNPKQSNAADLRFANYREAPWLIKKYALVNLPSATALVSLRNLPKPKEGRLDYIAFGDPLFNQDQAKADDKLIAGAAGGTKLASRGVALKLRSSPNTAQVSSAEVSILPRLPDTNEEIEEIAKVFNVDPMRDIYLQKRANLEEVLKANLANRKVVMFSTHGLVPGELNGLTQPALALTNPAVLGQKGDGLLKVDQILTLKLNADWVVLSACNTAAGEGEGAEALSGLGRAFFYAGARSLLVSSWPVDSQASRKLMTDLFKRQNQDKTISKPQALQQASLQLMSQGQPDAKEENYSYAHPLFWAPFVVVGD